MQVVAQKVGARVAAMAVKDPEEAAFGPMLDIFLGRRLHNVKHDGDSIFIIISDDALISVCGVSHNYTVLSNAAFSGLPARKVKG